MQENGYLFLDYQSRKGVIHGRTDLNGHGPVSQTAEHAYPDAEEPLKRELQSFLYSVNTGTPPVISGEEGTLCLEIAEQILATLTRGTPLTHFACGNLTKLTTS